MAISSRQLTFQLSGGPPYGIRLQGGNSNAPFVVSKIRPASKAEAIGVQEGDVIVAVNGITCRGLPHSTVTSLMDSADTSLQLLTLRGYTAYSDVAAVESLLGSQLAKLTTAEAAAIEQNRPEVAAPSGSVFGGVPESKPFVLQPITGKQRPFQQKTVESTTYDSSLPGISDHSNYSAAVTTNGFGGGQHQQLSSMAAADDVANPDNFYSREEQSYNDGGVSHHTVEETERKSFGGGSGSTTMTTVTRREYSTVSASSSGGFGRNNEFSNDPSLEFARQFLQQSDTNHQGGSVAKAAGGDRHKDWFGEQVENGTYRTQTVDNFRTNNGGGPRTNEIRQQQTYHVDSSSEKWNSPDRFSQTEQRPYGQDTGSLRRRQQPLQEQHQSQPPRNEVPEVRVYQTVGADGQHSIVLPDFTISIGAGPTMAGGGGAGRIPPPVVTVTPADGHGSEGRPVTLIGPTSSPWRQNDQSDVPDNVAGHVAASGSTSTQDVYALSNARYGSTSTPGSETGRQMPQHRAGMLQQQQQQQQHRVRYDDGSNVVVQQREEKSYSYNSNEANNANSSSVGSDWYGPVHTKHSTTTIATEGSQSSRPTVGVFDVQIRAEPTPVNNSSRDFDAPYDGYLNSQQQQQQQQQQRQQQQYHQQYEWSTTEPPEHELALNRKVDHVTVTVGDRPHFVHAAGAPSASLHEITAQSGPVTSSVYRAAGDHFEGNMESYQQGHQPTQYQQRPPISSQYGQSVRPLPVESDSNYGYQNSFAAPSPDDHYRPQYRPAPQLSEFGGGAPRSFDNNQYNGFPPTSFDDHQPNGPSAYQHYPPPPPHHHHQQQQQSYSQAGADTTTSIHPTDYRPKVGNKLPLNPHFQRDTGVDRQLGGQPADHVSHAPFAGPPPPSYAATAADYGVPFQQNSSYNHHQQQQFDSGPAAAPYSGSSESTGWSTGNVWSPPSSHQWQPGADRGRPGYNSEPSGTAVDNSYGHAGPHSHYVPSAAGYDPYDQYYSSNIRHQTAVPSDGYHVMPEQAMAVAPPPPPPAAAPPAPPPPPPNPYKVYGITSGTNDYERHSLESKVNLANSVAHSVTSPANSNSRGQKMFLRRQQNSHKWTKSGPDPVPEPPTKQQPHHQHQPSGPTTSWPGSSLQHSPNRPTPAAGIAHQASDRHGWGAAHGAVNESSGPSTNGSTVGFSLRNRSGSVDRLMSSSSSSLQGNSGGVTSSWSSTDAEPVHWSGRPQVPPSAAEVSAHHVMQRDGGQFSQHPSAAYRPVKLQFQNAMPPASGPRQPPAAGHPPPPPPRNAMGVRGGQPVAFSDL